jgi:osmotically-inducible protein OsmY
VTLEGSVPDPSQIEVAVSAAKGVKGVNAVSDKLTIKAEGQ